MGERGGAGVLRCHMGGCKGGARGGWARRKQGKEVAWLCDGQVGVCGADWGSGEAVGSDQEGPRMDDSALGLGWGRGWLCAWGCLIRLMLRHERGRGEAGLQPPGG